MIASIKKTVKIIEKYNSYAIFHCKIFIQLHITLWTKCIKRNQKAFPKAILGLSDHTGDNYTSFIAVALGATVMKNIL